MKILYLTKYSAKGPSSRMRVYQYLNGLEQLGYTCKVSPLFDDAYLDFLYKNERLPKFYFFKRFLGRILDCFRVFKYDVVWVQAEVIPYFPAIVEKIYSLLNIKFIVEYDDAIFHNYDKKFNLFGNKIENVMRYSDLVVAGNKYIKERAVSVGQENVVIVPTAVQLSKYSLQVKKSYEKRLVIGWIGTPNTYRHLELLSFLDNHETLADQIKFVLIGAGSSPFVNIDVELLAWSEVDEGKQLQDIDIGVMPLPNSPFEKGKCSYKLIQYMAAGKPVIASPVGMNNDVVINGENGFLCHDNDDWIVAINYFLENRAAIPSMGNIARNLVIEKYSTDATINTLNSILKGL